MDTKLKDIVTKKISSVMTQQEIDELFKKQSKEVGEDVSKHSKRI